METKLSVITVNLNNEAGLKLTLDSLSRQSFINYELIVIDGGSNDRSIDIIGEYEPVFNRIIRFFWLSEPDSGIYDAMNKGIDLSNGEYLLFLNSGDTLVHQDILNDVFSMGFSEDYVYGNLNLVNEDEILYKNVGMKFNTPSLSDLLSQHLPHQASFIRRDLFSRFGMYDETLQIMGDWEFCIRSIILNNCSVRHMNIVVSNYDMGGISSVNKGKCYEEEKLILRKYFPSRVITDIEELVNFKRDTKILDWLNTHRFIKQLMLIIIKTERKLMKLMVLNNTRY